MLVASDKTPASNDALKTASQLTSTIKAEVPTVATKVCATVLSALIPAALSHFKIFSLKIILLFVSVENFLNR